MHFFSIIVTAVRALQRKFLKVFSSIADITAI